jgi:hypothetical protein
MERDRRRRRRLARERLRQFTGLQELIERHEPVRRQLPDKIWREQVSTQQHALDTNGLQGCRVSLEAAGGNEDCAKERIPLPKRIDHLVVDGDGTQAIARAMTSGTAPNPTALADSAAAPVRMLVVSACMDSGERFRPPAYTSRNNQCARVALRALPAAFVGSFRGAVLVYVLTHQAGQRILGEEQTCAIGTILQRASRSTRREG